ncbi:MAG TPA: MIP/aquaporin family protein [Acidimicrobiales bacterium]|nr:MIP/aquaporin family protein [Acidimicrobiales bacterium]
MSDSPVARRVGAELLGSALLTLAVVGSGVAATRLAPGQLGLELLINAAVTGVALYWLIVVLAPLSGAHFNPVVSASAAALGLARWRDVPAYVVAQVAGSCAGALLANALFVVPEGLSTHARATGPHALAEVVATAGLVLVILVLARTGRTERVAAVVGAYIAGAYFFTSSTSFANPAITVGRMLTRSFAGIAPGSVPLFVGAQVLGAAAAVAVVVSLYPERQRA